MQGIEALVPAIGILVGLFIISYLEKIRNVLIYRELWGIFSRKGIDPLKTHSAVLDSKTDSLFIEWTYSKPKEKSVNFGFVLPDGSEICATAFVEYSKGYLSTYLEECFRGHNVFRVKKGVILVKVHTSGVIPWQQEWFLLDMEE